MPDCAFRYQGTVSACALLDGDIIVLTFEIRRLVISVATRTGGWMTLAWSTNCALTAGAFACTLCDPGSYSENQGSTSAHGNELDIKPLNVMKSQKRQGFYLGWIVPSVSLPILSPSHTTRLFFPALAWRSSHDIDLEIMPMNACKQVL